MLIKNPIEFLKDMTECAEKLGDDSTQYLGNGDWLKVSAKPYRPPLQICSSSHGHGPMICTPVSKNEAIKRLGEVQA